MRTFEMTFDRRIGQAGLVCLCAAMAACHAGPQMAASATDPAQSATAMSEINTGTDHFEFGGLTSSAWVSEGFVGEASRQFRDGGLHFTVSQTAPEGGLDIGLSEIAFTPDTVRPAIAGLSVCSSYEIALSGPGRWWAGPKISVNWQGDEAAKQNGDDWYENYIVEIASSSPDELHALFTGAYFQAEELPSTTIAGASYRHYKIRFHSWWQFWSVRQTYRSTGTVPIAPIVDIWSAHGLPADRVFDGVKANIETYGPVEGAGTLRMQSARGIDREPVCDAAVDRPPTGR